MREFAERSGERKKNNDSQRQEGGDKRYVVFNHALDELGIRQIERIDGLSTRFHNSNVGRADIANNLPALCGQNWHGFDLEKQIK
jgi:hypothetical protein